MRKWFVVFCLIGGIFLVGKGRDRVNPLKIDELMDIAVTWVDTALDLSEADMRKMSRLVTAQDRRRDRTAAE